MERNQALGQRLIELGLLTRADVAAAWERLDSGQTDLLALLLAEGRVTAEQAGRVEASLRVAGTRPDSRSGTRPDSRSGSGRGAARSAEVPQIPGYRVLRELGRGGMGLALLAESEETGALRVIKVLKSGADGDAVRRFEREAELPARIRHPNIVPIHGVDQTVDGRPCLVLGFVEGETLERRRGREPIDEDRLAVWFLELCSALSALHDAGVIHRDLKPENIMVEEASGRLVLIDFGLARKLPTTDPERLDQLTKTGELLGTPGFMAPEQLDHRGEFGEVSSATDVWGFGATLFHALTGEAPVVGRSFVEIAAQLAGGKIRRTSSIEPSTPVWLDAVCAACLQRDPDARPSLAELERAFETRDASGLPRRRKGLLVAVGLILLLGAALGLALQLRDQTPPTLSFDDHDTAVAGTQVTISGRVVDASPALLEVGERRVTLAADGRFKVRVSLAAGRNVIRFRGRDHAGLWSAAVERVVERDEEAPALSLEPLTTTGAGRLGIRGRLSEPGCRVAAGSVELEVVGQELRGDVAVTKLTLPLELTITDRVGNLSRRSLNVSVAEPGRLDETVRRVPPGGVLLLPSGTYSLQVERDQDLTLLGLDPNSRPVISSDDPTHMLVQKTGTLRLAFLELRQSKGNLSACLRGFGARFELESVRMRTVGTAINIENLDAEAGALRARDLDLEATGGGLILQRAGNLEVVDSVFRDRVRAYMKETPMVDLAGCQSFLFRGCRFVGARDFALKVAFATGEVELCEFHDSVRFDLVTLGALVTVRGCVFRRKTGISCAAHLASIVQLTGAIFRGGDGDPNHPVLRAWSGSALRVRGSLFEGCPGRHLIAERAAVRLERCNTERSRWELLPGADVRCDGEPVSLESPAEPRPASSAESIIAGLGELPDGPKELSPLPPEDAGMIKAVIRSSKLRAELIQTWRAMPEATGSERARRRRVGRFVCWVQAFDDRPPEGSFVRAAVERVAGRGFFAVDPSLLKKAELSAATIRRLVASLPRQPRGVAAWLREEEPGVPGAAAALEARLGDRNLPLWDRLELALALLHQAPGESTMKRIERDMMSSGEDPIARIVGRALLERGQVGVARRFAASSSIPARELVGFLPAALAFEAPVPLSGESGVSPTLAGELSAPEPDRRRRGCLWIVGAALTDELRAALLERAEDVDRSVRGAALYALIFGVSKELRRDGAAGSEALEAALKDPKVTSPGVGRLLRGLWAR